MKFIEDKERLANAMDISKILLTIKELKKTVEKLKNIQSKQNENERNNINEDNQKEIKGIIFTHINEIK